MGTRIGSVMAAIGLLLLLFPATITATPPVDDHKVVICHAIPPDTAANGWRQLDVDIASSGFLKSGHSTEHDADIIPPYTYLDFAFEGLNWDAFGQAIYENDCEVPTSTATPTPTPTATLPPPTPTPTATPTATPSVAPSPTPTSTPTEPAPSTSPTPPPDGSISPTPPRTELTAPPTDTQAPTTSALVTPWVFPVFAVIAGAAILLTPKRKR